MFYSLNENVFIPDCETYTGDIMERKRTPKYVLSQEEKEIGSLLGVSARRNKAVYQQFKELAARSGLKPSEAVEEALQLWVLSRQLRDVDPDTLVATIHFVNYMREQSIKELLALGELFTSEFFKVQMRIAQELLSRTAPPEQETKPSNPEKLMIQQMRLQMMQTIIPMYIGIMQQLMKALGNVQIPIQLPTQTPTQNETQTQTSKKKPIIE